MNRSLELKKIQQTEKFDIVVIGGGASGLGVAIDAASRGYKTALFEAYDFGKGTSSKSTKLVHGGVRYLAQGDVGLVFEALKERGLLAKNAKHLVGKQPFVIPNYSTFDNYWYATGLKIYDWMSRSLSLGKTTMLNAQETKEYLPTLEEKNLKGGVLYYDGQFDDARLAINLAQTANENGARITNYCEVVGFLKGDKKQNLKGVVVRDKFTDQTFEVKSKAVINATGVFIDHLLSLDDKDHKKSIKPSQGIHLVVDQKFLQTEYALMIPKTSDGRVLFAVPWHDKLVIGTTDTPVDEASIDPQALETEIEFVLANINEYLTETVRREDVLSVFAGLRPLAMPKDDSKGTKEISRSHKILVSESGMLTISGGKWTTYRKIAEDAIDKAIRTHKLPDSECVTEELSIHGNVSKKSIDDHPLQYYGADQSNIEAFMQHPELSEKIHPNYPYVMAQVVWAIRYEMAQTVEDVLARRIRLLFFDARAAQESAERVATLMATEMNHSEDWVNEQIESFTALAQQYILQ